MRKNLPQNGLGRKIYRPIIHIYGQEILRIRWRVGSPALFQYADKGNHMSLFGALNAAVSGMNAQSAALGNISDNVANSQTIGFKGTDTAFINYLTDSSASTHSPGAVVARPEYTNSLQGAVNQVSNPTSLAVSGAGFFAVQRPTGTSSFSPQTLYTRVGDFSPNSDGYLINSTGYALSGWPATNVAGTTFNSNALAPIQVSKSPSVPVPTANVTVAANLPSTPPAGTTSYSSTIQVHDAGGNVQDLTMNWAQVMNTAVPPVAVANQWTLNIASGTGTTGPMPVTFGATAATAGTITSIGAASPAGTLATTPPATSATGDKANIGLTVDYGLGAQAMTVDLGQFGKPSGVTQFAGSSYDVTSQSQDGSAQGNYLSTTIKPNGDVVLSYDNGTNATVARVPLANFNNPDGLQQQDGQAFSVTSDSGSANIVSAGAGGTGKLIVSADEGSNVDIAAQFTQMIVAQRAYTANSKIVTTANSMMQDTLNMVQG
jgi:flagellar hook protein FlgE